MNTQDKPQGKVNIYLDSLTTPFTSIGLDTIKDNMIYRGDWYGNIMGIEYIPPKKIKVDCEFKIDIRLFH